MIEMSRLLAPKNISIVLAVLLAIALGTIVYLYRENSPSTAVNSEKQLQETIAKIGKLMVLPDTEQPTLATVSDPLKLQDQPFFVHSQAGDVVLIYTLSRKAILYRPSLNKIIEVAPINANTSP